MRILTQRSPTTQQISATISALGRKYSERGREVSYVPARRQAEQLAPQTVSEATEMPARRFGRDFSTIRVHAAPARAIQPKLTINKPGDPHEEEADRISEQIMRTPEPRVQRKCACGGAPSASGECESCGDTPPLQRMAESDAGPIADAGAPDIVDDVLRAPARSLDPALRAFMEARTGYDFGRVRVHADPRASASAKAVAARAYTVGHHVVFGEGQFAPGTAEGRRLIAHELVHVMQQGGATVGLPPKAVAPSGEARDRPAGCVADTAVGGTRAIGAMGLPVAAAVSPSPTAGFALQRQLCDPTKDTIKTGALPTTLPNVACDPTPQTLQQVRASPGASPTILGVTESGASTDQISFQELTGSMCRARVLTLAQPVLNFSVYTKAGDFPDGTEPTPSTPANRPCAGKTVRRILRITADAAAKLRQGEAEHCDDMKLAFALSWGKFNQASKDLEGDYCAANVHVSGADTICDKEFANRFAARTGVAWTDREQVANCLLAKSKLRDDAPNRWHDVVATDSFYAKDCSAVTYIYTAGSVPEVGRHPSSEIVKGCGEK